MMNLLLHKIFVNYLVLPVILLIGCFIGCQKGIQVEMVEGTVTFDGKPVANADVCFTPKSEQSGIPAMGKTDLNGTYKLTSAQGGEFGKGAVVGEYEVRIIKYLDLEAVASVNPQIGDEVPLAKPQHHLPEKYANVKTSGLTTTIKKGNNIINFNLTN
jgi:hypothetical protein